MEVIRENEGLDNEIRSPRIQKLGMALAGFSGYIHPDRVQVFGSSELLYLHGLSPEERTAATLRLKKHKICCIFVTKGLDIPELPPVVVIIRSAVPSRLRSEK